MHNLPVTSLWLAESQVFKAGFQCLILTITNMQNILLNEHPLTVYLYSE